MRTALKRTLLSRSSRIKRIRLATPRMRMPRSLKPSATRAAGSSVRDEPAANGSANGDTLQLYLREIGRVKLLTRDELQGVIAHEFSHVLNGDTRLNMKLMGLAHGLFWPTIVGRVLLRGSPQPLEVGASIFDEDAKPTILPTAPIGILFLIIGGISSPFVRLLKSLICREREWLADAAAVQFTRNPAGIAGALKKIGGLYRAGRLDTPYAETASHLYFVNSTYDPWFSFQSTHPPLAKRILVIDPTFDGQFPHIKSVPRQAEVTPQDVKYDHLYEESVRRAREEAKARGELE